MHPIKQHRPDSILAEGEHNGFKWLVSHNNMGFRCGYVYIPKGHPWHGKDYDDIDANCHGGLTYSNADTDSGWWIGFDCAHCDDAPDIDVLTFEHERLKRTMASAFKHGVVRTQEYVENQCRKLCEQAAITDMSRHNEH